MLLFQLIFVLFYLKLCLLFTYDFFLILFNFFYEFCNTWILLNFPSSYVSGGFDILDLAQDYDKYPQNFLNTHTYAYSKNSVDTQKSCAQILTFMHKPIYPLFILGHLTFMYFNAQFPEIHFCTSLYVVSLTSSYIFTGFLPETNLNISFVSGIVIGAVLTLFDTNVILISVDLVKFVLHLFGC